MMPSAPQPEQSDAACRKVGPWLCLGVLAGAALITAVGYGRCLTYPFLWDDTSVVAPSAEVARTGDLGRVFALDYWRPRPDAARKPYRPVRDLGFVLSHALGRGRPAGFHAFSLCVHVLNALLVFAVGRALFKDPAAAAAGALIFAAWPTHVEAVVWAKNSAEPLACIFALGAVWLFVSAFRAEEGGAGVVRPAMLAAAGLVYVLALLSKESVVALPALMTLWALMWHKGKLRRRAAIATAPFWAISMAYAAFQFAFVTGGRGKTVAESTAGLPLTARAELAGRTVGVYVRTALLPAGHSPWRTMPIPRQAGMWPLMLAGLAALALAGWLVWSVRQRRCGEFGWWWLLLMLAPAANLVAFNPRRPIAEQRLYFPTAGLALLAAGVWAALRAASFRGPPFGSEPEAQPQGRRPGLEALRAGGRDKSCSRHIPLFCAGALVAALTALSCQAAGHWRGPRSLWKHAVRHAPARHQALHNLGAAYQRQERWLLAIAQYRKALAAREGSVDTDSLQSLGNVLMQAGRLTEAAWCHEQVIHLNDEHARGHLALGVDYAKMGRLGKALKHYERALELRPDWTLALNNIGLALMKLGEPKKAEISLKEAEAALRKAIKLDPHYAIARLNLAETLLKLGRKQEARAEWQEVLRLDPHNRRAMQALDRLKP